MKVPESITHAEFRAAIKPLYDLVGLTDKEVYANGFRYEDSSGDSVGKLSLTFAARRVDDDSERPVTRRLEGLEPLPAVNAELAWVCTVQVV